MVAGLAYDHSSVANSYERFRHVAEMLGMARTRFAGMSQLGRRRRRRSCLKGSPP
jgi:hypothetical protein